MLVDIFVPCFIDQLFPETAFNMIRVLEAAGCQVNYNPNQTCCSQPAYNAGFLEEARQVANKFIHDFEKAEIVVAPSASCVAHVRDVLPGIFDNSSLHNPSKDMQKKSYELSEFLVNVLGITQLGSKLEATATYHDSCSALRECKIKDEPRLLLSHVEGLNLIEMEETELCCGFGGTFSVKFEPIASSMAERKIENALRTGAEYMISSDWSCLMHLDGIIRRKKHPLRLLHLADVLASGL